MGFRLTTVDARATCFALETGSKEVYHDIVLPRISVFGERDLIYTTEEGNDSEGNSNSFYKTGYRSINNFATEGLGQMSMLLLETFFLSKCLPCPLPHSCIESKITVLYLGAYPGDHINYLASMFPSVTFELYDRKISSSSNQKIRPRDNIKIHPVDFTDYDAREWADKGVYLISDIRGNYQKSSNSPELNSSIIDSDMWDQIKWCQLIKPIWSLLRYRPKLPDERPLSRPGRPNYSRHLTLESDTDEKRRLYYRYPDGYFLRIPMAKHKPSGMFLITNSYALSKIYYHDDMLSLCRNHNENTRRVALYINPITGTFTGFYGEDRVREFARRKGITLHNSPRDYICGSGWDHRAMFYIMSLYLSYKLESDDDALDDSEFYDKTIELILTPFVEMRNAERPAAPTSPDTLPVIDDEDW